MNNVAQLLEKSNLFDLAEIQLRREGKDPRRSPELALDRAFELLHKLDVARRNTENARRRYSK